MLHWINEDKTILAYTEDSGHVVIVEPGHLDWDALSIRNDILPYEPPPPPPPPTQEQIDAMRQTAYQQEADPIFFKWQRGEATEQQWLDKIADIRARYPDVA